MTPALPLADRPPLPFVAARRPLVLVARPATPAARTSELAGQPARTARRWRSRQPPQPPAVPAEARSDSTICASAWPKSSARSNAGTKPQLQSSGCVNKIRAGAPRGCSRRARATAQAAARRQPRPPGWRRPPRRSPPNRRVWRRRCAQRSPRPGRAIACAALGLSGRRRPGDMGQPAPRIRNLRHGARQSPIDIRDGLKLDLDPIAVRLPPERDPRHRQRPYGAGRCRRRQQHRGDGPALRAAAVPFPSAVGRARSMAGASRWWSIWCTRTWTADSRSSRCC